ncbi:hypothetical protein ACFQAT_15195 [Undibacterium arcticum]|uniref:hypothetical protein n=1 Tax=Undibacterium arcticum TaxID=1762892 RepID=UPI003623B859
MLIFLDTEFTDFIDIELISIGLVSQDGREFYAERNDFDVAKCNNFVRAGILPMLTQNDSSVAMTRAELKSICFLGSPNFGIKVRFRLDSIIQRIGSCSSTPWTASSLAG